jgi:hypothetical protein
VHVQAPRPRVIIPRRAAAPAPTAAQAQAVERQQIVQTRQVMLVPQQVLVPFVQTTTTGPIRVAGTQETQVLNLTSVTNAAAVQGLAVTGGAAVGGVAVNAAQVNAAAAAPAGAAATGAGTTGATAANPQTLADCLAQLRAYEQQIQRLNSAVDHLVRMNAATAPTTPPIPAPASQPLPAPRPIPPSDVFRAPGK